MAEAHLVPRVIQWTQHDPILAEELKGNVPSTWSNAQASKFLFLRDPDCGFVPCLLKNDMGSDPLEYVTNEGRSMTMKKKKYEKPGMYFPLLDPKLLGTVFDDLVNLDELNEATILHSLNVRFRYDRFYTAVGTILVSLNPFKWVTELYAADVMKFYRDNRYSSFEKPPHVFDLAERSFLGLLDDGQSQAIIISGESGAGKTEAAKKCVEYLAAASREVTAAEEEKEGEGQTTGETKTVTGSTSSSSSSSSPTTTVADRIMAASPVLEAFGNAKTLRNNNSSRFGKWMVIEFGARLYDIQGCSNVNYLLEKSRVVSQDPGERNFHIFYQLLLGTNHEFKEKYMLNDTTPENYHYVGQSGCLEVESKSDEEDFNEVLDAMNHLGFPEEERETLWTVMSAVLHLGNVNFVSVDDSSGGEGSATNKEDGSKKKLKLASDLLGITSPDWFERALTITLLKDVRGSFIARRHSAEQATDNRDAISKELYNRTFNWLVKKINSAVQRQQDSSSSSQATMVVGILDIFGFEIFESNSFEQLCINFANEKLQQHFNSSTFKEETAVYDREGISYDEIVFVDNEDVIALVGSKGGILHSLDEEIKVPRGSSKGFFNKLVKKFTGGKQHIRLGPHKPGSSYFTVKHYAGDVKYDYFGFLEKNKDTLFNDLVELMSSSESCSNAFVNSLFSSPSKAGGKKSVSQQFRSQLDSLMNTLNACTPHYIRCIKANSVKKPDIFMGGMILEQLKYSGVFEAVEIRRSGFPCRRSHAQFRHRYWMLADKTTRTLSLNNNHGNMKKQCGILIDVFAKLDSKLQQLQLGKTMVLYKADQQRELEQRRMALVSFFFLCVFCVFFLCVFFFLSSILL